MRSMLTRSLFFIAAPVNPPPPAPTVPPPPPSIPVALPGPSVQPQTSNGLGAGGGGGDRDRGALLSSISGFKKGGLKQAETKDCSGPRL